MWHEWGKEKCIHGLGARNRLEEVEGTLCSGWLRHFAISHEVGRSITDGVDSASNGNEYRIYLLVVKAAGE
jgi:hypothetical protein